MNQDLARLAPTPHQLADYCGGSPVEFMQPPELSQVVFACNKRGRKTPFNSITVSVEGVGDVIERGDHLSFPYITCVTKDGERKRGNLSSVLGNLFDLTVDGWVVYSYRAEAVEHA